MSSAADSGVGRATPVRGDRHIIGPTLATTRARLVKTSFTLVDRLARSATWLLGRRARAQAIAVRDGSGEFLIGRGSVCVRVSVADPRTYRTTLMGGAIGLAESYIDGWWDCDDLTMLLRLLNRDLEGPLGVLDRVATSVDRPLTALARHRAPKAHHDRVNVRAHYDLPGALFEAMLDESMVYSCAIFDDATTSLHDAQMAKLEALCERLELGERDHLLEIGTGWGALAIYAARTRGCRVTTTTISLEQRKVALRRVHEAGLDHLIDVLDLDYRDLTGTYDKIVSVEMIEAVDWRLHGTFFRTCERLLKPDGLMVLQAITIDDASFARAKFSRDFIKEFIFPGGCLPSVASMSSVISSSTSLRLVRLDDIGEHYATTLAAWRDNFDAHWPDVAPDGYGESFTRLWHLYLAYCEAGFLEHHVSDVQIVLAGRSRKTAP